MARRDSRIKQSKDGTYRFTLNYPVPGRPRQQIKRRGIKRYEDAQEALNAAQEVARKAARGHTPVPSWREQNITLGDYMRRWLAGHGCGVHQEDQYRWAMAHILPVLGDVRLVDLTPSQISDMYKGLKYQHKDKPLSQTSRFHVAKTMGACLEQAVEDGIIPRNFASGVKRKPRPGRREMQTWTEDESRRFAAESGGHFLFPAWMLQLQRGLRPQDVAGLRWTDVDLPAGRITLRHWRTQGGGKVHTSSEGKTEHSGRTISLDAVLVRVLSQHRLRQRQLELASPEWVHTPYVFVWESAGGTRGRRHRPGEPVNPCIFRTNFNAVVKKAGLRPIRLYDLRHTAATLMLLAGEHLKVVSEMLGHSRTAITQEIYFHVTETMHAEAGQRLTSRILGEGAAAG